MADSYEDVESTVVWPDGTLFRSRDPEEVAEAVRRAYDAAYRQVQTVEVTEEQL